MNNKASGRPLIASLDNLERRVIATRPLGFSRVLQPNLAVIRVFGLRLKTQINQSVHWRVRAYYVKSIRTVIGYATGSCYAFCSPPYTVELDRIGPRRIDDDNLMASLKPVRDEVAKILKVNDGDINSVSWAYKQVLGPFGVEIRIAPFHSG